MAPWRPNRAERTNVETGICWPAVKKKTKKKNTFETNFKSDWLKYTSPPISKASETRQTVRRFQTARTRYICCSDSSGTFDLWAIHRWWEFSRPNQPDRPTIFSRRFSALFPCRSITIVASWINASFRIKQRDTVSSVLSEKSVKICH